MNQWPSQDEYSLNLFYGKPDTDNDGFPNMRWESENLMRVIPPYPMVLAWDIDRKLKTITVHRKVAKSLALILGEIATQFTQLEREQYHLNRFGGAYMFRLMRGSHKLSIHSWGAAIDLAPEINQMGAEYDSRPNMMPLRAVRIFESEGWKWGGGFPRPDAMHFQAAV